MMLINIGKVQGIIETLGQFGLPTWVTEFDSKDHREHSQCSVGKLLQADVQP